MYGIKVSARHQALANSLLVCDHRHLPASITESLNGIHDSRKDDQLIRGAHILSREVLIDNTIPVKKRDTNRVRHQLADGR
jgi:hypothetical protein